MRSAPPWWLRATVRLLPRGFRREWEADLLDTLGRRWDTVRGAERLMVACGELSSLLWVAFAARRLGDERREPMYFEPHDNRPLRVAWVVALSVHLALFAVVFPSSGSSLAADPGREVIVLTEWKPPRPPEQDPRVRTVQRRVRPVPIPDPDPDVPEPVVGEIYEYTARDAEIADTEFTVSAPEQAPPALANVVRGGVDVRRPQLLRRVEPRYPEIALRARLQCFVVLEARIDRSGSVVDVKVAKSCGLGLDEAAVDAVSQWKYAPTLFGGRPVEVILSVRVDFRLQRGRASE